MKLSSMKGIAIFQLDNRPGLLGWIDLKIFSQKQSKLTHAFLSPERMSQSHRRTHERRRARCQKTRLILRADRNLLANLSPGGAHLICGQKV